MLSRNFIYLKNFYSTKQVKIRNAIRRNLENKLEFGQLLETKTEKSQADNVSSPLKTQNTELFYLEKLSKNIKILHVKKIDSFKNENSKPDINSNDKISKNISLPDIILRNIETFPLKNNTKKMIDKSNEDKHIYNFQLKENKKLISKNIYAFPSVTRILNQTLSEKSKEALEKWKQDKIQQLGLEGFEIYYQEILEEGKLFHKIIQDHLSGNTIDHLFEEYRVANCWKSLSPIIQDINNIRVLESHVVHPKLCYQGVIDCVADYCGTPMIIDWKKSAKPKETLYQTYDYPIQLAAYLGALNYDNNYPFQLNRGLIVVAYTNGMQAHAHSLKMMELNKYWFLWLKRLKLYYQNN